MRIFFDVDSTIVDLEGIDWLASLKGVEKEVSEMTNLSMNGDLKFEDIFAKRLDLISPNIYDLEELAKEYIDKLLPDAENLIRSLIKEGHEVYLVSGGFIEAISKLGEYLNIPQKHIFANKIYFDDEGFYNSYDAFNPLVMQQGKYKVIRKIKRSKNDKMFSVYVGDGSTDIVVKELVNKFIGFGGIVEREIVKKKADFFVKSFEEVGKLIRSFEK